MEVRSEASSELKDHVDCAASLQVVVRDLHFVCQLLASEDKSDLVYHYTFLLLQSLFHLEDCVVWVEVKALFPSCESLNGVRER